MYLIINKFEIIWLLLLVEKKWDKIPEVGMAGLHMPHFANKLFDLYIDNTKVKVKTNHGNQKNMLLVTYRLSSKFEKLHYQDFAYK